MRSATVIVPATSANLGPGFDSFGLALGLHNRFSARLADEWTVRVHGEGVGAFPEGVGNPVAGAMQAVFAEAGNPGLAAAIECDNSIPPGAGLGSSAAAIVGGMLLADRLVGDALGEDRLLELAVAMEGHPDNVAAALLGGFTLAWSDPAVHARRIEPGCGVAAVIVTADRPLPTTRARSLLPAQVPHADAAFNAARAGALAAGIALGDEGLIAAGLVDRIHEPYRSTAVPDLQEVRDVLLDAGATGVVLSGAGPTVIAIVCGDDDAHARGRADSVAHSAAPSIAGLPGRSEPLALSIERGGAHVE